MLRFRRRSVHFAVRNLHVSLFQDGAAQAAGHEGASININPVWQYLRLFSWRMTVYR